MTISREKKAISGKITAPPSKSSMQRAVACSLLAEGTSRLRGGVLSDDSEAALRIAMALGASVHTEDEVVAISGSPLFKKNFSGESFDGSKALDLDCGESGLCMRMFSPIAALLPRDSVLRGRGSLARRPMGMVELPLRELGASCHSVDGFTAPLDTWAIARRLDTGRCGGKLAAVDGPPHRPASCHRRL